MRVGFMNEGRERNKKVIVYGNTMLSRMLYYDALHHPDFDIAGFAVDRMYRTGDTFLDLPQVCVEEVVDVYPPDEYDMIAILGGYSNMRNRPKMYDGAKALGYHLRNYISPSCDITPTVVMGENNLIFGQSHVGIGGRMGNNNILRQMVYLGHDFVLGNHNVIGAGSRIGGTCTLEEGCYLGLGVTVINNTRIARESLVGAGSVVIRHTEAYSKNVGNPSRVIGYHEEEGIRMKVEHE